MAVKEMFLKIRKLLEYQVWSHLNKPNYLCCATFPGSCCTTMLTPCTFIIVATIPFHVTALLQHYYFSCWEHFFCSLDVVRLLYFSTSITLEDLFSPQLFGYCFTYQHWGEIFTYYAFLLILTIVPIALLLGEYISHLGVYTEVVEVEVSSKAVELSDIHQQLIEFHQWAQVIILPPSCYGCCKETLR